MTSLPDIARLRAAQETLAQRPLQAVIDPLVGFCQRLRNPADAAYTETVATLQTTTGLSAPVIAWGLETTLAAWVGNTGDEAAAIRGLLAEEFRNPAALSSWVPTARPGEDERWSPVPITLQILAGNVFAATLHQLLAGLLARTGQLVKPAHAHEAFLAQLITVLNQVDPELAACVVPVQWDAAEQEIAAACYTAADVITVTGSDTTLASVRAQVADLGLNPVIHGFGHRVSAGYIARYCWETPAARDQVYAALAQDVCAYDQAGCLSPQIVFLEDLLPQQLHAEAERIFQALQAQTAVWPLGTAARGNRRAALDQLRMRGVGPVLADDSVAVLVDTSAAPQLGPGGRTLVVAPVGFPQGLAERLRAYTGQLGTLGVALHPAVPLKGWKQASKLFPKPEPGAEVSALFNRICPIGQMQSPQIAEPHDGRPRVRIFMERLSRSV